MPPIMFEDGEPLTPAVRLRDIQPAHPFLVERHDWIGCARAKDRDGVVYHFKTGERFEMSPDTFVYPIAVKMVLMEDADSPGCDAAEQIVEDARVLRSELEHARKVAEISKEFAKTIQNDLKAAKADADRLRAELAHTAKDACGYMESLDRAIANRNDYCDRAKKAEQELTTVRTERDAWKARSEFWKSRAMVYREETVWRNGDRWHCDSRSNANLASIDKWPYRSREEAMNAYDSNSGLPPIPDGH